jgi:hypothetical protein
MFFKPVVLVLVSGLLLLAAPHGGDGSGRAMVFKLPS